MKPIFFIGLPLLLLAAASFRPHANLSVSGAVKNEKGLPIQNVIVTIAGAALYDVTDKDGEYEIEDVPDTATLNFSSAGFNAKAEKLNKREVVNVVLVQGGVAAAVNAGTTTLPVTVVIAKQSKLVSTINKLLSWGPQLVQAAAIVQNVQQKFRDGKAKKAAEKTVTAAAEPASPVKQNLRQDLAEQEPMQEKPY